MPNTLSPLASPLASPINRALNLAVRGFQVFPIAAYGSQKKPHIRRWPDNATSDPQQINKWWTRWPDANIGIHCQDLLVIDVDGPIGHQNLKDLLAIEGATLPDTYRSLSGNAEPHHYQILYRVPTGQIIPAANKPLHTYKTGGLTDLTSYVNIDVRSTRGQIVAPGSIHKSGQPYRWDEEMGAPATVGAIPLAPRWLLRLLGATSLEAVAKTAGAKGKAGKKTLKNTTCKTTPKSRPQSPIPTPQIHVGDHDAYASLLEQINTKYPISLLKRNDAQHKAVWWLFGKRCSLYVVERVMGMWLVEHQDEYETSYEEAAKLLKCQIGYVQRKVNEGRFDDTVDHEQSAAKHKLHPLTAQWLADFMPFCTYDRLDIHRRRFVQTLLTHYDYMLTVSGDSPDSFRMTSRQLMAIYKLQHGVSLQPHTLSRRKSEFIDRLNEETGKHYKASVACLAVELEKGRIGKASTFQAINLPMLPGPPVSK